MLKKIIVLSGITLGTIGLLSCVLNNDINKNAVSVGKGGGVTNSSSSPADKKDNAGNLQITWPPLNESEAQAASTKEDIEYLNIILSSDPILKANNGQVMSKKIKRDSKGQNINNIPVGTIGVKFEAYDKNDQVIGTVQADNVPIKAGQTNSLKLKLILKDTVIVENKKVDTGGLDVTVTIEDGKTVVTKTDSIPKEGLFIVNDPANKSK